MPLYEYGCECGRTVERLSKVDDPPPDCECGREMSKMVSRTSFSLKGDGWAKDNYGLRRSSEET